MNFDYPDLDNAFISTPSPLPSDKFYALNQSGNQVPANNTVLYPSINRTLKPPFSSTTGIKPNGSIEDLNSKNRNSAMDEDLTDSDISRIVNQSSTIFNKLYEDSNSSPNHSSDDLRSLPSIPSRNLKPKELLNSLKANKVIEKETNILKENLKIEKVCKSV